MPTGMLHTNTSWLYVEDRNEFMDDAFVDWTPQMNTLGESPDAHRTKTADNCLERTEIQRPIDPRGCT